MCKGGGSYLFHVCFMSLFIQLISYQLGIMHDVGCWYLEMSNEDIVSAISRKLGKHCSLGDQAPAQLN